MPAYEKHSAQAKHNEGLLKLIRAQNKQKLYEDWCVTVAFYTALHYFEAMLAVVKPNIYTPGAMVTAEHCTDHNTRSNIMKAKFENLHYPYSVLYKFSRLARYNCHSPNTYVRTNAEKSLEAVKKECRRLILNKKK